ncbi:MAG: isoprenyl transferase [Nitratireductor sp.]|nr:isoprenyl transferase [Nitratireductor sp.]
MAEAGAEFGKKPRHIAIIMDGNGRWAKARGLARFHGHRRGVETVKQIVRAACDQGIEFVTLYSFSTENWSRPREEVSELMNLLKVFIRKDLAELHQKNIRVRIIGDRENLPSDIAPLLLEAEALTRDNTDNTLVIAFNYGGRHEIVRAVRRIAEMVAQGEIAPETIDEAMIATNLDTAGIPDPDLIIRTGGEKRISNFLMWQSAYSEFYFTDCRWPDFTPADLNAAIEDFAQRQRRFGGVEEREPRQGTGS